MKGVGGNMGERRGSRGELRKEPVLAPRTTVFREAVGPTLSIRTS